MKLNDWPDGTDRLIVEGEISSTDQAKTTREIMQIDQRAWIGIEYVNPIPPIPENGKTFEAKIQIKNTGKTPARNIVQFGGLQPVGRGGTPDFSYVGIPKHRGGSITPNGSVIVPLNPLINSKLNQPAIFNQELLDALKSGEFKIYAHGRVEYDDVFGDHHWMTFCAELLVPFNGNFGACEDHNDSDDYQSKKQ